MGEENKGFKGLICPVMSAGIMDINIQCEEEKCAWWDLTEKMCVVKSGLLALRRSADQGGE